MELQRDERPAQSYLKGTESRNVEAGRRFAIGLLNPQEVWLNEEVPAGKIWQVRVTVTIQELDA